ncbi:MAG: DUF3243 domain-containing protein [Bacillota bacterium]|nr:MAG: DUF3243 domain-containing protein [Bacillota bacterium]
MGMSKDEIADKAEVIGDFLANNVDPQNPEQGILKELWEAAEARMQQEGAKVLINGVQRSG